MKAILLTVILGLLLGACTEEAAPRAIASLRGADELAFICAREINGELRGVSLDRCSPNADDASLRLYTLVTQPESGEVAVVSFSGCASPWDCGGRVLDLEYTQPGVNFLPVGAEPVDIVSTPGGVASFVAVAEPGREGIFGLPTSCVGPRQRGAAIRDLRTWPACRLPSAPGSLAMVTGSDEQGCEVPVEAADDVECPADLRVERAPRGARKLVVAMPELGQLWVLDAQRLLNRAPGSFEDCQPEQVLDLHENLEVTEDGGAAPQCFAHQPLYPPQAVEVSPVPADFAQSEDRLYVADLRAPVVHVLDTSDACNLRFTDPLQPTSVEYPETRVTTRRVAVSPVTASGQRFVYAVDNSPNELAGTIMVFDVSTGVAQRTPIVRPRSEYNLSEPPDRIRFNQEVRDVTFGTQDWPIVDTQTGIAYRGLACDPDPGASGPATEYRPNRSGTGASPAKLRGVFAFAALHTGFVAVIDVEDLDAPCRRPAAVNPLDVEDKRGCRADGWTEALLDEDGNPTVTDEASCQVVQPHRVRSARLVAARSGGAAAALRYFPRLRAQDGTSLSVDQTSQGRRYPHLLGFPWPEWDMPETVRVGSAAYATDGAASERLVLDPTRSERNHLLLPQSEPRAYLPGVNTASVVFEGLLGPDFQAAVELTDGATLLERLPERPGPSRIREDRSYAVLEGGYSAEYCAIGVEDEPTMGLRGVTSLFGPEVEWGELDEGQRQAAEQFADTHTDYVEVVQELLPRDDPYWAGEGASCGADLADSSGRALCERFFGSAELPDPRREFRVLRAFNDQLVVEPRRASGERERQAGLELLQCCFPEAPALVPRAGRQWVYRDGSGFRHDVRANPETLACERIEACDYFRYRHGRVFEVACDGDACDSVGPSRLFDEDGEAVGYEAQVCVVDGVPLEAEALQPPCMIDALTGRFAIYRGDEPSQKGMGFNWQTSGGFEPLTVSLVVNARTQTSSPRSIEFLPQLNHLIVADGGSVGVVSVGLRTAEGGPGMVVRVAN